MARIAMKRDPIASRYTQGAHLEMVTLFRFTHTNPPDHVPDSNPGDDLYKRVLTKTKERDSLILGAKPDRNDTFGDIVKIVISAKSDAVRWSCRNLSISLQNMAETYHELLYRLPDKPAAHQRNHQSADTFCPQ